MKCALISKQFLKTVFRALFAYFNLPDAVAAMIPAKNFIFDFVRFDLIW